MLDGLWRRPVALRAMFCVLWLVGIAAWLELPLELLPTTELPSCRISAVWPGASPLTIERDLVAPLERSLQGIAGVEKVRSYSAHGVGLLVVEMSPTLARNTSIEIGERLEWLRPSLPRGVVPRLDRYRPELLADHQGFFVIDLLAKGETSVAELAEAHLIPALRALPGVAGVEITGHPTKELKVVVDPVVLARHGLEVGDVRQGLAEAGRREDFGHLGRARTALLYRHPLETLETLRRLPIQVHEARWLRLDQLATLDIVDAPRRALTRIDGREAVVLRIDRQPGHDVLATAARVTSVLQRVRSELDGELDYHVAVDRSAEMATELGHLGRQGAAGLVFALAVLLLMAHRWVALGLILVHMMTVLAMVMIFLRVTGASLNLLTLAALVLLAGFLLDNALVLVEEIQHRLDRRSTATREDRITVAHRSFAAVWPPLLAGTVSTLVVLLPLGSLDLELRQLFVPLALMVALGLLLSLVFGVVWVSFHGALWLTPRPVTVAQRSPSFALRLFDRLVVISGRFPRLVLLAMVLALGIPLWLLPESWTPSPESPAVVETVAEVYNRGRDSSVGRDLWPRLEAAVGGVTRVFLEQVDFHTKGELVGQERLDVSLDLPFGAPMEETDRLARRFEGLALGAPGVSSVMTRIQGASATIGVELGRASGPPGLQLRQRLIDEAVRLAGVEVGVAGLLPLGYRSGLNGDSATFEIEARGSNWDRLNVLVDDVARRLRALPRVAGVDVHGGWKQGPEAPRAFFLSPVDGSKSTESPGLWLQQVDSSLGSVLPDLWLETKERAWPVRLVSSATPPSVDGLLRQPIETSTGRARPLGQIARLELETEPARIERVDQRYLRRLEVFYQGPHALGVRSIEQTLASVHVSPGYSVERVHMEFFSHKNRHQLYRSLAVACVLLLLTTAALFESWRLALATLVALPAAALGVAGAFLLTDAPFAEGAFLGLVLLTGVAVNDAILLLYRFHQFRDQRPGTPALRLYRLAVRRRWTPMWTTTLTSAAALLPVALDPTSNPFWLGLAVTVIGGLITATLLLPCLLAAVVGWSGRGVRAARSRPRVHPG
ncbi:MAG: efflux RND transporter permease subunit [Acidobacteriota bacterium]